MENRAWPTIAFFVLGIEVIYWGMTLNGSNFIGNPVWGLVSWLHKVMLMGLTLGALFFVWCFFMSIMSEVKKEKELEEQRIKEHELDKAWRIQQEQKNAEEVEKQRAWDAQRDLEIELNKQKVIDAKLRRSSEDAARLALDDF